MGILLSCLITLALCVWTAIHPNIVPRPTSARTFCTQFRLLLMGVLAPGLLLTFGGVQYLSALDVRKKVIAARAKRAGIQCVRGMKCTHSSAPCVPDFPLRLALLVVMGGFVLDPGDLDVLPMTLTQRGFVSLYQAGQIDDDCFDLSVVDDKAKASFLAKFLVCAQASVRDCLSRVE